MSVQLTIPANGVKTVNCELLQKWYDFLDVSERTKAAYKQGISNFRNFFKDKLQELTREDIIAWRNEMAKTLKASTIHLYLTAIKLFFRWLSQNGLALNIADHVKGVRLSREHRKDSLTLEQSKDLLKSIKVDGQKGLRNYAIISLMITTGLREIEVVRANIEDLRAKGGGTVLFIQGKGRSEKSEYVKIAPQVEKSIREYLKARGKVEGNAPLFASESLQNKGQRLTTRSISRIVKDALIEAGFNSDRLTAHSLRHTTATIGLLNNGGNVREAQQCLRHSSLNTTLIYSHDLERSKNNFELIVAEKIFEQV